MVDFMSILILGGAAVGIYYLYTTGALQEALGIRATPGSGMDFASQIEKVTPKKPGGGIGLDFGSGGFKKATGFDPKTGRLMASYADDDDGGMSRIKFAGGAMVTDFG